MIKLLKYMLAGCALSAAASMTLSCTSPRADKTVDLKVIQTTDVHGNFFPYNFITRTPWEGSMARVATFVDSIRNEVGKENVILLDNGDILQGQPSAYYYNYIDTVSPHIAAEIYRYLGYDAATIGNHDVETGHAVYDRWIRESPIPVLGGNIISTATSKPYLPPYTIIERNGVKIAVIGLLTPSIPAWLPENLWSGLKFEPMVESARRIVSEVKENENPDIIIGQFHSGRDSSTITGGEMENASLVIANEVDGFDLILYGHDHQLYVEEITRPDGSKVWVCNPAHNANAVSEVDIKVSFDGKGNLIDKKIEAKVTPMTDITPSQEYLDKFEPQYAAVTEFVDREIGTAEGTFTSRDAFFGPSSFMTLVHDLQLEIANAEISFAAPLSFDASIKEGTVRMNDMFNLYKYENLLYAMELSGREIKDYLEESYGIWTNQITSPDGHLLLFADENPGPGNNRLKNPSYNFDSAAGIIYTVDVTKPKGSKVNIISMQDGTPFDFDRKYRVAINSYRGNGGGNLLTRGAGIELTELPSRILFSTDKDLRYYLMEAIEKKETITPRKADNWKFIPENIARPAAVADSILLFSGGMSRQK